MVISTITLMDIIYKQTTVPIETATCVTYSTDYYQRINLESWLTNREQTPLNRCQQLPAPYKRFIDDNSRQTD